jgi:Rrf2 family nitric oxide-sensitive transcriptional repressor
MHLTRFSDYTLRVLLYLAVHQNRAVSVREMSRAYGVSNHHLVKIVQRLVEEGFVVSVRGRRGGLRLVVAAADINVGRVVRLTEPHMNLVECFERVTNTCPIDEACGLKLVLREAQGAFLDRLDAHTIADFLPRAPSLIRLWTRPQPS